MTVLIQIDGREAIPVRAIPLLTNWRFMSPDIVCHVLGGTAGSNVGLFGELQASCLEGGRPKPINADWWVQFPLRKLQALTKEIKSTKPPKEVGYSAWQQQSLKELPAGAFVWRDEYQKLHDKNWNSRYTMNVCALQEWDSRDDDDTPISSILTTDELADQSSLKREIRDSIEVLKRWKVPDFSPFLSEDQQRLVMEGFEDLLASAAPVSGKKWIPEKVAELRAYREVHTESETAKQFGISGARIRQLLPTGKPQKKPYSVFTHHKK